MNTDTYKTNSEPYFHVLIDVTFFLNVRSLKFNIFLPTYGMYNDICAVLGIRLIYKDSYKKPSVEDRRKNRN